MVKTQFTKHDSLDTEKLSNLLANTGDMALKRRARRIIEEINPQSGDKILEVGCGDGFYLHLLSNLGIKNLKLFGIDIDEKALESAKRNLKGRKIKLQVADVMKKLPFKNNSFDKIIMSEVCEHLADDVKGLKEVKRVLKKKGILVVTVPNYNFPFFWDPINWFLQNFFGTHIINGFWAGIWNQHIRLYKPYEIKRTVEEAGFVSKKVESLTYWCIPFNHNLMHIAARKLHSGTMSTQVSSAINKFKKPDRKPFIIKIAFDALNLVDRLNDIWRPKNRGVGIFIKVSL